MQDERGGHLKRPDGGELAGPSFGACEVWEMSSLKSRAGEACSFKPRSAVSEC